MKISQLLMTSTVVVLFAGPALAQSTPPVDTPVSVSGQPLSAGEETQRDVNQQDRIENGLKDGDLSTKEAAHLEKGETRIDQVEAKDMKDGTLSAKDKAQIQAMQNKESNTIKKDDTNNVKGNPNGVSDKRMQADVQRNVNQENRIENGVKSGNLTNKEDAEAAARANLVTIADWATQAPTAISSKGEQYRHVQNGDNRNSRKIWRKKHNEVKKP